MRTWLSPIALLAGSLVLAACPGNDSTGSRPVATVLVTLPAGLLIGDTVTAVVVLKDSDGNVLTGRTVTFQSSGAVTASVTGTGLLTALLAGGPITITATSEGKSGTATVTVRDDQRFGYVWANNSASASYSPSAAYSFNSTSGANTITRSAAGTYAVRFAGLGRAEGQRENVQVTSYFEVAFCSTAGWQTEGTDLVVNVRCFSPAGAALDSRYTVLVTGARALQSRTGFALADQPTAASYTPSSRHNSATGAVTIARSGTGQYGVTFGGLARGSSGPEMVMVTQVGSSTNRCVVSSWDFTGFTAFIACTDFNAAAADAQFSILVLERGRLAQRTGFAWANEQSTADYPPSPTYSHNSAGLVITAHRSATGVYQIDWEGLIQNGTETVVVTAYGAANRFCRTTQWGMQTATAFRVNLACFDPTGAPADSRYDIIVVQ